MNWKSLLQPNPFFEIIRAVPWMFFLQQELKDNPKEKLIVAGKNHGFLCVYLKETRRHDIVATEADGFRSTN